MKEAKKDTATDKFISGLDIVNTAVDARDVYTTYARQDAVAGTGALLKDFGGDAAKTSTELLLNSGTVSLGSAGATLTSTAATLGVSATTLASGAAAADFAASYAVGKYIVAPVAVPIIRELTPEYGSMSMKLRAFGRSLARSF